MKPEPVPLPANQYIAPSKKKEEIDKMSSLISDQEKQNDKLERELENLKAGRITFEEFEKILNDPA